MSLLSQNNINMENLTNLILNQSAIKESLNFALNLNINEALLNQNQKHFKFTVEDLEVVDFWPWQIVLITLYTFAAVASLFMNITTILVLLTTTDRSITSELWKFLVLLSISDIGMSLFCIPTTYL